MASIEIKGIPQLLAKLGSAAAISTLRPPMQRSVYRLETGMKKYPPARAGSRYRRTGSLGRRWVSVIAQNANGLVGTTGNSTSYGPYVESSMFQAQVHKGLWQTDQDVATKETPIIVADFEHAIQEALD